MPTYAYACENCGNEFEQFQSITARPLQKCPDCGRARLRRLIGTGAGIIFRGSGFYETDYRSESYKKAAESEKKATDKKDAKAESKESKSSSKPPTSAAEKKSA